MRGGGVARGKFSPKDEIIQIEQNTKKIARLTLIDALLYFKA